MKDLEGCRLLVAARKGAIPDEEKIFIIARS